MKTLSVWNDITREQFRDNIGKDLFDSFEDKLDSILIMGNMIDFQTTYYSYNHIVRRQTIDLTNSKKDIRLSFMIVQGVNLDITEINISVFAKMGTEFYEEVKNNWPYLHKSINNSEEIEILFEDLKKILCLVKN